VLQEEGLPLLPRLLLQVHPWAAWVLLLESVALREVLLVLQVRLGLAGPLPWQLLLP
jgi:hypothetical protein